MATTSIARNLVGRLTVGIALVGALLASPVADAKPRREARHENRQARHEVRHARHEVRHQEYRYHDNGVRRQGNFHYAAHHHPGYVVRSLPAHGTVIRAGHAHYHYCDGVFYRPAAVGYTVVAAPLGIVVASLPFGYATVWVGGQAYQYYGGNYFLWSPGHGGYVTVAPPM